MGWKTFNVAGVYSKEHPGETMTRLDKIEKYVSRGSKFVLEREPDNEFDFNAIAVYQVFKLGGAVKLGYVPNNKKRGKLIADKLAPLIDAGWEPNVEFGMKFIDESTGQCKGLQLRYEEN